MKRFLSPVDLHYTVRAGSSMKAFLSAILDGRILGRACPNCESVYCPPRPACPKCASRLEKDVEVGPAGAITTFSIVNIPFEGQQIEMPYVVAWILLDGADVPLLHLVGEVPAAKVETGMRVEAVFKPREERTPSLEAIKWFRPLSVEKPGFKEQR